VEGTSGANARKSAEPIALRFLSYLVARYGLSQRDTLDTLRISIASAHQDL
jgi:hypothetical protein